MARQVNQITCILTILLFSRCAQMVPLTGGERDQSPPKLIEAVPENNTTSFASESVLLRFDEFVQLKDLNNQLMISPRLRTPPEISAEGRNVVVKLNRKELAPNTTYRLDFGKAIADMNESNSIPGFSYVFSTGSAIDSLRLRGAVSTASNNLPFAEALVALYRANDTLTSAETDSLPLLVPPDYSTKTNEGGQFSITNLPPAVYRVFAIRDNNRNSVYDGVSEKIGFAGDILDLKSDSSLHLRLFTEDPPKLFVKRAFSPAYGSAQVIFNRQVLSAVETLDPSRQKDIFETNAGKEKDTIQIFYKEITDTLALLLRHPVLGQADTVRVPLPAHKVNRRRLRGMSSNITGGLLAPGAKLQLVFPVWMDTVSLRPERLRIASPDDSLVSSTTPTMQWSDVRTLEIAGMWQDGASYTIKPDTGMVYDLDGTSNDTIAHTFKRQGEADLGKLILKVALAKKQTYLVQLINAQDAVVAWRGFDIPLSATNVVTLEFDRIVPGTYRAKIIFDDNANGRWDTGNLKMRMQPEQVIIHTKELKLLADWEIEEEIQVRN